MKLIVAYVSNHKFADVETGLLDAGVTGMSVSPVRGFGQRHGPVEVYRGREFEADSTPMYRFEVFVSDDELEKTVEALRASAYTGEVGDGKIMVLPVDDVMRIRTGERGMDVIHPPAAPPSESSEESGG